MSVKVQKDPVEYVVLHLKRVDLDVFFLGKTIVKCAIFRMVQQYIYIHII